MRLNLLIFLVFFSFSAFAQTEVEKRLWDLSSQLRCLVCQNQSIADSDADLAQDLKNEIRTMLQNGKSDAEILNFMTERYGDFVLYNPPFKAQTLLLWCAPLLLVLVGALSFFFYLKKREQKLKDAPSDLTLARRLLEEKDE